MVERARRIAGVLVGAVLAFGCSEREKSAQAAPMSPPKPASTVQLDPTAEADRIFQSRCQVCHGKEGKGDGPGSLTLDVKPRNYTDGAWQKSVRDEQIRDVIVKGGAAVGKDPGMPSTPELAGKPEVLAALVRKIRSFATDGAGGE